MSCEHPLLAMQLPSGAVVFKGGRNGRPLYLPCGQCMSCRIKRSQDWAIRIMHEASSHDQNCFLTLTYDDECLPDGYSLEYRHVQLFLKRFRRAGYKIRYVCAGEYGSTTYRPHYHLCVFGYYPADAKWCGGSEEQPLCSSQELDELWSYGATRVGSLTHQSAGYVARYVIDKITGDRAHEHYCRVDPRTGEICNVQPEFLKVSTRPAIGHDWYFRNVISPTGEIAVHGPLATGKVVVNETLVNQPKAYDKLLKLLKPELASKLMASRLAAISDESMLAPRMRARAVIVRARMRVNTHRGDP